MVRCDIPQTLIVIASDHMSPRVALGHPCSHEHTYTHHTIVLTVELTLLGGRTMAPKLWVTVNLLRGIRDPSIQPLYCRC